jgi:uracil-DNA glycosylase family 4
MSADSTANELLELLRETREHSRYFGELGVETVEPANTPEATSALPETQAKTRPLQPTAKAVESAQLAAVVASDPTPQDSLFGDLAQPKPSLSQLQTKESMEDIWRDIGDCKRCGLCEGRTQVVNTHGNHKARLMFVGEAPGADEDAQGKPFVGRAGQLLTKIIEAIGFKREEVLIGNVNRCRPPGNRQPTLEEAAICRPFLFREIAAVQPDVIVVMGNTAVRNLLGTREGITRIRGKFQDFRGIKVMPTFHPAYLLRDPSKKRETWEDLKKVRDYLDSTPSTRLDS